MSEKIEDAIKKLSVETKMWIANVPGKKADKFVQQLNEYNPAEKYEIGEKKMGAPKDNVGIYRIIPKH